MHEHLKGAVRVLLEGDAPDADRVNDLPGVKLLGSFGGTVGTHISQMDQQLAEVLET